ncbi:LysR family transcriptional regulator [Polynucleobacter sp. Fuers-14]|nr:LysR family transcriptional regulator [Polynucleobacter sp. Fuers-14]
MNSDDLNLFSLVADAGSISSAALAAGCDASTLSRKISQLEAEVGTRLFRRSGRGVALTPQGESLLDHAKQVRVLIEQAVKALSDQECLDPLKIRIAAQPTIAKVLFGDLFHAISKRYPHSQIHFSEGLASGILPSLHAGEVDIALLYRPEYAAGLSYEPLVSEGLCLLTPNDYSIAQQAIEVADLATFPLILPSTHHGLRVMIDSVLTRHGMTPNVALESDSSIAITMQLVHKGCGCTLLPLAAAAEEVALGRLKAYPLADSELQRCVALVVGKTSIQPNALWVLNKLIRDVAHNLIASNEWPGAQWIGQQAVKTDD